MRCFPRCNKNSWFKLSCSSAWFLYESFKLKCWPRPYMHCEHQKRKARSNWNYCCIEVVWSSEHLFNFAAQFGFVSQSSVSWLGDCGPWFSGAAFTLTVSHHKHHSRALRGVGSSGPKGVRRHFYDSFGRVSSFTHKIVQGFSVKASWVYTRPGPKPPLLSSSFPFFPSSPLTSLRSV